MLVPSTITLTPIIGSPNESFTLPVTVFWANATKHSMDMMKATEALFN